MREILMATTNFHKAERFKHYFSSLGLSVVTFSDKNVNVEIIEDGITPEENALKKAEAGFKATGTPTFGVDYWFFIARLSDDMQPGPYVRRIFKGKSGERVEATDEEMLKYYSKLVKGLGGKTDGRWISAIALVTKRGEHAQRFERKTFLTATINEKRTPGEPLNSMQIDPSTGKYFTDLTQEEWMKLQTERERGYIDFMREHLKEV